MAKFEPNAAQKLAIETRGSAVLVSAGAGSGKTRVLTERLMARLRDEEHPADIDSFLIITYTRAAAGELRGRILSELASALAQEPGNRHLRRQNALCRRAHIGTIHSFCSTLLREFSHQVGLSPDFAVADEDRCEAMKAAALERTLEQCYAGPDKYPGFLELADTVGAGRDDRRLSELVLSLHANMQCHPWPKEWAEAQIEQLRTPVDDAAQTPWGQEVLRSLQSTVDYWSGELERCLGRMRGDAKLFAAYGDSFSDTAAQLRELSRCLALGWDRARDCLPIRFEKLKTLRKPEDPELAKRVKDRRDACKKVCENLASTLSLPSRRLLDDMARTEPAMSALLRLVLLFDESYEKDKRRAGLVDYSDLEHKTAQLLTERDGSPTDIARQVSARYTEILVDEYQDVSQVQDTIFCALSQNERNLFLVGDVKQSIYRFRLADPTLFTERYEHYADAPSAAPGEARRILLQENYRSRREILDAANTVFSLCMSKSLGDIDYDDNAALRCAAHYEGTVETPEITLLQLPGDGEDGERPDKDALEARYAAREIRRLVESGTCVQEDGQLRPMRYGDVAILLRSVKKLGGIYRRALAEEGVPTAGVQAGGFFTSVEVSTVLSLLAVLDNPHQDIPLIAVLRSPAFGFTVDELSRIRAAKRDGDYYDALCAAAKSDEHCRAFLDRLDLLRRNAVDLQAAELIEQLLEELELLALCSAMSDGEQRRARLLELVALAEGYEKTGYRGLHRFVLWLRRQAARGDGPVLGSAGSAAVQILSMHKSKGLEYPVVFLCSMGRRFNMADRKETVLVHPRLGLGPKVTDLERRVEYPTLARRGIDLALKRETLSEELRVLYVAMTRAKERLYITAIEKDVDKHLDKLRATLTRPMDPEALSGVAAPIDWLLYAALDDTEGRLRYRVRELETGEGVAEEESIGQEPDPETLRLLDERLRYVYPYRAAENLPSKVTATGLKGRFEPDAEAAPLERTHRRAFRLPDFARAEKPATGTEKGIATHLVLQYMDFARTESLEAVQGEIERLRALRFLSDREAEAVDAEAIVKLFASPLGQRMKAAPGLHREFRFSLLSPAQPLLGEGEDEQVLLQGVVDCYLDEAEGLTVIDYKTDRLATRADCLRRAEEYRPQLTAYARALERICQKTVRECVLYFLSAGEAVGIQVKNEK